MSRKFSMHLTDEAENRLQRLEALTRSEGFADVIKLALLALDEQVELIRKGGHLYAKLPKSTGSLMNYNPLIENGLLAALSASQAASSDDAGPLVAVVSADDPGNADQVAQVEEFDARRRGPVVVPAPDHDDTPGNNRPRHSGKKLAGAKV